MRPRWQSGMMMIVFAFSVITINTRSFSNAFTGVSSAVRTINELHTQNTFNENRKNAFSVEKRDAEILQSAKQSIHELCPTVQAWQSSQTKCKALSIF